MRICQNCNTPIDENATFCVNCGVKLVNQPVSVQEKAINEQPSVTEQYEQSSFKSTETSTCSQQIPPAGTPVYNQPVTNNNYCCTPQLHQVKPSSKGQLAWAIVLLCFAVLLGSPIFVAMQIIAIICISDSKVAVNTEIFMHKLKTAKILNIISTVCLSLIFCEKIISGLLSLTELLYEDDFGSYFSNFY